MNLAARTARSGIAHLPEIILRAEFVDPIFGDALSQPQVVGFAIALYTVFALEDGQVQLVFRNAEPLGRSNQLPRVGDGVLLEIVAEGEVPQHLEEGVVAIGKANVFQIVMLAARADAFLRRGGLVVVAFFQAEEDVLELVHARVGEQQRGIVLRDERRGMHLAVPLLDKVVQKPAANFRACQHEDSILNHEGHRGHRGSPEKDAFLRVRSVSSFIPGFLPQTR